MSAKPWYLNVFNDLTWFVGIVNIFSWSHDSNVEILCPENPLESSNGLPRNNSNMKCGKKTVSFASCHCLITKHLIDNGFVWKYGNHQIRRLIIFFPIKNVSFLLMCPILKHTHVMHYVSWTSKPTSPWGTVTPPLWSLSTSFALHRNDTCNTLLGSRRRGQPRSCVWKYSLAMSK